MLTAHARGVGHSAGPLANRVGGGEGHPGRTVSGWLGSDAAGVGQMSTNIAKIRLTDDIKIGYIYSVVRQAEKTCNLYGQFGFRKGKPRVIGGRKVADLRGDVESLRGRRADEVHATRSDSRTAER